MTKFTVSVQETSYGFAEVEADTVEDAHDKAKEANHNGNIVWISSEFHTHKVTEQN